MVTAVRALVALLLASAPAPSVATAEAVEAAGLRGSTKSPTANRNSAGVVTAESPPAEVAPTSIDGSPGAARATLFSLKNETWSVGASAQAIGASEARTKLHRSPGYVPLSACQYWDGRSFANDALCQRTCTDNYWTQACYSAGACRCGVNCVGGWLDGRPCW